MHPNKATRPPWKRNASYLIPLIYAFLSACEDRAAAPAGAPGTDSASAASYVGSTVCTACHTAEASRWTGSQHAAAMQAATAEHVLGDFSGVELQHAGVTSRFFERAGEYWVSTDGADGSIQDFRVTHTFGVDPLQQYLVEFPGGRRQALSVAWDTRPASAGGQRWFHLYPGETIDSDDPLHWTRRAQNWNTMCAACHSTNVSKGYQLQSDTFSTTSSEVAVGCEGCHGAGSLHASDPRVPPQALPRRTRSWLFAEGARIAHLAPGTPPNNEVEVCAPCHSRRTELTDGHDSSQPYLDAFRPALLDPGLYYPDGQILDEVFVYGSFVQSAMAAAGVTCSDCHEPHSAKLLAEGNGLCLRCHSAAAFDTPNHHRHAPDSESGACVSCHMRSETYMVVDPRRDHSFRVPRPDLSARLGVPNPCVGCHTEQSAAWASEQVAAWYPEGRRTEFHFGEALHAARTWARDRSDLLRRLIADGEQPAIARATAVGLLTPETDPSAFDLVDRALADSEPLVRLAGLGRLQSMPDDFRLARARGHLQEPLRALRAEAARSLVGVDGRLGPGEVERFKGALSEYIAIQEFNSDRAAGLLNLAQLAVAIGQTMRAEQYLVTAQRREPALGAVAVNLADLYRAQGRESEAVRILEEGIERNPQDPSLALALGLALVRGGATEAALGRLKAAMTLATGDPYYAYVYGVALNSLGQQAEALQLLRATHEQFPGHWDTLYGLATMARDAGRADEAFEYATRLSALAPSNPAARSLLADLQRSVRN